MKSRAFITMVIAGFIFLGLWFFRKSPAENPGSSPPFVSSLSALASLQKEITRPAVVVFSASWCAPCVVMKKNIFPAAAVQAFHDKFHWAMLDTDEPANKEAVEKFAVSTLPHIEFLNAAGESIGRQAISSASPEEFAKTLESILALTNTPAPAAGEKK